MSISSVRIAPDADTVNQKLGLIKDLAGTWAGDGFNLIARPDHQDGTPLYLQLNQTRETLEIDPIGSPVPNRGFGQDDIELHGLTYLQKIRDAASGGAMHIEPGIWITQPPVDYPSEQPPAGGQIVARMGSIPHGNAILAQGSATPFHGPPTLSADGQTYAFSIFPSFNSTPFGAGEPLTVNAAGSSEQLNAPALTPPAVPFPEYDLSNAEGPANTRTPFGTTEPALPAEIDGVAMQDVVNDPVSLLQAKITRQVESGHRFKGVALNVATRNTIQFRSAPNAPGSAAIPVTVADGGGGAENLLFLEGGEPAGAVGPNALTSLIYSTFWIETVTAPEGGDFLQLQYAQMTVLNFGILHGPPNVILGWPHISVATLRKTFA